MIVPVRKDPEAFPACHERVDIHPKARSDLEVGAGGAPSHLSYRTKIFGTWGARIQRPNGTVLQR